MEIYLLSERLDDGHYSGVKLSAGRGLEVFKEGLKGRPAELPQKPSPLSPDTLNRFKSDPFVQALFQEFKVETTEQLSQQLREIISQQR